MLEISLQDSLKENNIWIKKNQEAWLTWLIILVYHKEKTYDHVEKY